MMGNGRHIRIVVAAAGGIALAGIVLAADPTGPFALIAKLGGGVVLYHRLQRDSNFENDTRRRIFDHVRGRPAESISQIATTVGVSHSTASYHLDRLVEFNLLTSTPDGNKVRYFVNGGLFTEEDRRILAALTNAETRRVLAAILTAPGTYRAELTTRLGVSSPTINWHLARLAGASIVTERPRGRNRYLFADARKLARLLGSLKAKIREAEYAPLGLDELYALCAMETTPATPEAAGEP